MLLFALLNNNKNKNIKTWIQDRLECSNWSIPQVGKLSLAADNNQSVLVWKRKHLFRELPLIWRLSLQTYEKESPNSHGSFERLGVALITLSGFRHSRNKKISMIKFCTNFFNYCFFQVTKKLSFFLNVSLYFGNLVLHVYYAWKIKICFNHKVICLLLSERMILVDLMIKIEFAFFNACKYEVYMKTNYHSTSFKLFNVNKTILCNAVDTILTLCLEK